MFAELLYLDSTSASPQNPTHVSAVLPISGQYRSRLTTAHPRYSISDKVGHLNYPVTRAGLTFLHSVTTAPPSNLNYSSLSLSDWRTEVPSRRVFTDASLDLYFFDVGIL